MRRATESAIVYPQLRGPSTGAKEDRPDRHTHHRRRPDDGTGRGRACQGRPGRRDRQRHQTLRRLRGGERSRLLDRFGRVLLDARTVGLRQDDHAPDDRRLRDPHRGRDPARRQGRVAGASAQAQRQHRVPALRAVPPHDGVGQRRLRTAQPEEGQGRGQEARRRAARDRAPHRLRQAQARPALRRSAAARGAGPCAGQLPERAAARRTARRPRPQAATGDAVRAQAHPARGRHHVRLRDPRPRGSVDDERPHRGHERRQRRPDRQPHRDLRPAVDRLRRRASSARPTSGRAGKPGGPTATSSRSRCSVPR